MFSFKILLIQLFVGTSLLCSTAFASSNHIQLDIVAHPRSVLAEGGKPVTLSVLLKGQVKTLQWRKNGEPIELANKTSFETVATKTRSKPDTYDVVVHDVFGNSVISQPATVSVVEADSPLLVQQTRQLESLKLQSLFNLIQLFDQVGARVSEPLQHHKIRHRPSDYFTECADRTKVEFTEPSAVDNAAKRKLTVELNACFVPKANQFGDEAGALVSGSYSHSTTEILQADRNTLIVEQQAKNLALRFPHAKYSRHFEAVNFDVVLNGTLTAQTDTSRSSAHTGIIRKSLVWSRGSRIENPQTGVSAEFISGTHVQESFGAFQKNEFFPSRESKIFDRLKLKVNGEEVLIHGIVTTIHEGPNVHRQGEFKISINGKHALSTHSVVTAPTHPETLLPNAPKMNGFFLNDHANPRQKSPLKVVSPHRTQTSKVN